jgi:hypothetical protein
VLVTEPVQRHGLSRYVRGRIADRGYLLLVMGRMNWRRGLFRLWIVGSALFVLAVAFVSYSDIRAQFDRPVPNKIFEVKRPDGRTFDVKAPDMQSAIAIVKALPEGFVLDKPELSDADVGLAPDPWLSLGRVAAIGFGVPLVALVLGSALVWAFSGFAAKRN